MNLFVCLYITHMQIEFDKGKKDQTWEERCQDFERCGEVFAGPHFTIEGDR